MLEFVEFILNPEKLSFSFFVLFTLVLLFHYWWFFSRVAWGKDRSNRADNPQPVSVVICAKNEYENLKKNMPLILDQDYPSYEVILVNDFSEDDSYFLLKSFEEKHPHFKVVNLRENVNFFAGKKLALAVGIKSARHDTVVLTDADCRPSGRYWLQAMSAGFTGGKELVLAYGGYRKEPGLLNRIICYDTVTIAMQYLGAAMAGAPYMGVGRNLAYKRSLFFKAGGFASHYQINSGDDDLFVNKVAKSKNTAVILSAESFTWSEAKKSFVSWFKQKKRHMSTGAYYKKRDKFRLGLFAFSHTFFYLALAAFLVLANHPELLYAALSLVFLKVVSLGVLHYYVGKRLDEKKLFLYSPIFDVIFAFFNPVFAISNLFFRKNKWK